MRAFRISRVLLDSWIVSVRKQVIFSIVTAVLLVVCGVNYTNAAPARSVGNPRPAKASKIIKAPTSPKAAGYTKVSAKKKKAPNKQSASRRPAAPTEAQVAASAYTAPPPQEASVNAVERLPIQINSHGVSFTTFPSFRTIYRGKVASLSNQDDFIFYSVDPDLQRFVQRIVRDAAAPHLAVVVMEPDTGRILAASGKSISLENPLTHAGFPAASLFKVVTTSAALERGLVSGTSEINFRGGTYTLTRANYSPNARLDRNSMTLAEALGRSCNPVFARVALQYLSAPLLRHYASSFGFNSPLGFEAPIGLSQATIPSDDYELSRAAAGFGEVYLSPIHAATLMSGIANRGLLPRPMLVDKVLSRNSDVLYQGTPQALQRIIRPETATALLEMMKSTITDGTSRREFSKASANLLAIGIAAKTGTLSGDNPKGLNHWFIAAAPADAPRIAIAVISVNPTGLSAKASHIGRLILEHIFG